MRRSRSAVQCTIWRRFRTRTTSPQGCSGRIRRTVGSQESSCARMPARCPASRRRGPWGRRGADRIAQAAEVRSPLFELLDHPQQVADGPGEAIQADHDQGLACGGCLAEPAPAPDGWGRRRRHAPRTRWCNLPRVARRAADQCPALRWRCRFSFRVQFGLKSCRRRSACLIRSVLAGKARGGVTWGAWMMRSSMRSAS